MPRSHFLLDPDIVFLNHGSFGACPRVVLEHQRALRDQLEREPVRFFMRELPALLDEARGALASFLGAEPEGTVFVRNATQGVAAVLASCRFEPGDELLTTNHVYGACRNALSFHAERAGARVVVADVRFPLESPDQVVAAIEACVSPKTKLALIDHITSPSGLIFPIAQIVARLRERGVETLVDGAHAPGMVPLQLEALGAAYYTGNLHKWVCAPKGAAFLYVRQDKRDTTHPAIISHGRSSTRARSRLLEEFDWVGTDDPTSWLCVPLALRFVEGLLEGGWPAVWARQKELALGARLRLSRALGTPAMAPASMIGALVTASVAGEAPALNSIFDIDPLQDALFSRHRIEVPVFRFPTPQRRCVRVATQIYVTERDLDALERALVAELSA